MNKKIRNPQAMSKQAAEALARDCAAFDAMCRTTDAGGLRRLVPPPMRLLPPVMSAAQLELRRSQRLGVAA